MKLEILDQAVEDLVEAFEFYEEREAGLGTYFLDCLFADIELLRTQGGIHRKAYKQYHRSLSRRFPFALFYTLEGDTVYVRAVLDCRRSPAWIRRRLH